MKATIQDFTVLGKILLKIICILDAMTQEPSKMMTINVPDEVKDFKRIIILSCGTLISVVLLLLMIREIRRYTLL